MSLWLFISVSKYNIIIISIAVTVYCITKITIGNYGIERLSSFNDDDVDKNSD